MLGEPLEFVEARYRDFVVIIFIQGGSLMRRGVLSVLFGAIVLCVATSTWAVEFSADAVTTAQGRTMTSKMYVKGKKARMEMQGQPSYTIMRGDKEMVWIVNPEQKNYMEMKLDPNQKPKVEDKVQGEVSRKLIGSETIDRHPSQKYEVTCTVQGRTEKVYQWIATDIKFPVKTAAVDGSWATEYRNIRMGGQSNDLFEVPAGYRKMSMPTMPGMLKGLKIPQ
jgi:hypothetical protein